MRDVFGRRAANAACPVLFAHGEQDAISPPDVARRLAAAAPQATLRLYPDVGHAPFLEVRETFLADLDAFLARTDILICLLPLTPQTEGMLDAALFARLPEGAMLVQVGRGRQTDQQALLAALDSGHLSAAWLDVTEPEPLPQDHPLWSHPRVIVTPHIASRTRAEDGARYVLKTIRAHQSGQPVPGLVDPDKGY